MSEAAQLRQKAARYRRAASIPTEGPHRLLIEGALIELAEYLEREAEALEINPHAQPRKCKNFAR
jgi:hypothetical protein